MKMCAPALAVCLATSVLIVTSSTPAAAACEERYQQAGECQTPVASFSSSDPSPVRGELVESRGGAKARADRIKPVTVSYTFDLDPRRGTVEPSGDVLARITGPNLNKTFRIRGYRGAERTFSVKYTRTGNYRYTFKYTSRGAYNDVSRSQVIRVVGR